LSNRFTSCPLAIKKIGKSSKNSFPFFLQQRFQSFFLFLSFITLFVLSGYIEYYPSSNISCRVQICSIYYMTSNITTTTNTSPSSPATTCSPSSWHVFLYCCASSLQPQPFIFFSSVSSTNLYITQLVFSLQQESLMSTLLPFGTCSVIYVDIVLLTSNLFQQNSPIMVALGSYPDTIPQSFIILHLHYLLSPKATVGDGQCLLPPMLLNMYNLLLY
jgi:hypothetical protein